MVTTIILGVLLGTIVVELGFVVKWLKPPPPNRWPEDIDELVGPDGRLKKDPPKPRDSGKGVGKQVDYTTCYQWLMVHMLNKWK